MHTRFYSMVNLVAGREVVPEFIQDRFQPAAVAQEIRQILDLPAVRERIREDLQSVSKCLHRVHKESDSSGLSSSGSHRIAVSLTSPGTQFADPIQRAAAVAESILKGVA